jgi:hypothetical protein
MPNVVPKGAPDSRPLEVSKDSLDAWTERGYVEVKAPAKKTAKRSSSKK